MLLDIVKAVDLGKSAEHVWEVIRVPQNVAGCIPNVREFEQRDAGGPFSAIVEDKIGPFRVEVPISIEVSEDPAARRMTARIAGSDKRGQARLRGEVTAIVLPAGAGSRLELASSIEVLGRLAALGAVPMRRRADQIFDVFVRNLSTLLDGSDGRDA